ncbi:MAG TPA: hypothetical protein VNV87_17940 [Acidimicrobiales bacterium]|jgi:hypothetical protein|nr:hypothetical protein [Acidimicrobiales bacterium]
MRFVAIGTHPPVTTEEQADADLTEIAANREHCRAQVANGNYEAVYVMEGVGRFIIANVESDTELLKILSEPPDHPERQWAITRLLDYESVIDDYLRSVGLEGAT